MCEREIVHTDFLLNIVCIIFDYVTSSLEMLHNCAVRSYVVTFVSNVRNAICSVMDVEED